MPIRTHVITGDTVLDTDQIMSLFGIPKDHMLIITGIYYSSSLAAGANNYIDMSIDNDDNNIVHTGDANANQGKFRLHSNGTNYMFRIDVDDNPMIVQNRLVFTRGSGGGNWTLTFVYDKSTKGEMDLSDEQAEYIDDIKQVGGTMGDATAGKEFYQVGDRSKVGV